jgi:hypothetical protein
MKEFTSLNSKEIKNNQPSQMGDFSVQNKDVEKKENETKKTKNLENQQIEKGKTIKESIEKDFEINLADYSTREQVQFVNFLSSKTTEEVEKVKDFLNQTGNEKATKNRLKAFLSLESGEISGDEIVSVGEMLEYEPEIADKLFAEYALIVDSARESSREIKEIYNEVFFDKKINDRQVQNGILRRANRLLLEARQKLAIASIHNREDVVEVLIKDLKNEERIQKNVLENLSRTAKELNEMYDVIEKDVLGQDTIDELDEMRRTAKDRLGEDMVNKFEEEHEKHKKYDSKRIRDLIATYKSFYTLSDEEAEVLIKTGTREEDIEKIRAGYEKNEKLEYEEKVKKLEKLLTIQISLEKKLDQLVHGYSMPILPTGLKPENVEKINQAYFSFVKKAEKEAEDVMEIIKSVFHERKIQYEEVFNSFVDRALEVIENSFDGSNRNEIRTEGLLVKNIVDDLNREARVNFEVIDNFKNLNTRLVEIYNQAFYEWTRVSHEKQIKEIILEARNRGVQEEIISKHIEKLNRQFEESASKNKKEESVSEMEATLRTITKVFYEPKETFSYFSLLGEGYSEREAEQIVRKRQEKDREEQAVFIEKYNLIKDVKEEMKEFFEKNIINKNKNQVEDGKTLSEKFFQKYQEIIDQAKNIKQVAKDAFMEDRDFNEREMENLMETILDRASSLLKDFSGKIARGEISEEELLSEIESYKTDLIFTASVWKNFKNKIKLKDLKGITFEQDTVEGFTQKGQVMEIVDKIYNTNPDGFYGNIGNQEFLKKIEDLDQNYPDYLIEKASKINQMLEIYKRNYQDRPELQRKIVDDFIKILQSSSPDTNIYLLNKNQDMMGFIRYDELGDGKTKYAGSFNIDTPLHQLSLGGALFLESLEKESENYEIVGICDGFSPANIFYVEQGGYKVEEVDIDDMDKNKFPDFYIRKTQENNRLSGLSKDELLRISGGEDVLVRKFSRKINNWGEIMELVNEQGYNITRLLPEGEMIYCGFEKKREEKQQSETEFLDSNQYQKVS